MKIYYCNGDCENKYYNSHINKFVSTECVIIFSECNFTGKYYEVCEKERDLTDKHPATKSIFIP